MTPRSCPSARTSHGLNVSRKLLEDGEDYVLEADTSAWITVGNGSLRIEHGSDGLRVTLYPLDGELEDDLGELSASWNEIRKAID